MTKLSDFRDWLNHPNLIVGRHDCDQDRLIVNRALEVIEIDQAVGVRFHRAEPHALGSRDRRIPGDDLLQQGRKFNRGDADVLSFRGRRELEIEL